MTHAYQEIYLSNAQALLGDAFDYAINACGVAGDTNSATRTSTRPVRRLFLALQKSSAVRWRIILVGPVNPGQGL